MKESKETCGSWLGLYLHFPSRDYLILSAGSIYLKDRCQLQSVNSISLSLKIWVIQNSQVLIFLHTKLSPWNKSYLPSHFSCLFNTHSSLSLLIMSQPLAHMWQCQLEHMQQTHNSKLLGSATQDNLKEQLQIKYYNIILINTLSDNVHCDLNPTTVKFFESLNTWYQTDSLFIIETFWHFGSK